VLLHLHVGVVALSFAQRLVPDGSGQGCQFVGGEQGLGGGHGVLPVQAFARRPDLLDDEIGEDDFFDAAEIL